jgi:hypothetical protein
MSSAQVLATINSAIIVTIVSVGQDIPQVSLSLPWCSMRAAVPHSASSPFLKIGSQTDGGDGCVIDKEVKLRHIVFDALTIFSTLVGIGVVSIPDAFMHSK